MTNPDSESRRTRISAPMATLIAALIAAAVGVAGIVYRTSPPPIPNPTPSPTPAALAVNITPLAVGQEVAAVRYAGHHSAHFKIPVLVSGKTAAPNSGVYILVFDRGTWEIQREATPVKAIEGHYEIDAWSGGGSLENRTQEGQAVQLRAVVADIDMVSQYATEGTKEVSDDAREVRPYAISPVVSVKVRPIKQL